MAEAVFGLTELHRSAIAGAGLVANPGCYSTAAILALAPLARAGLIEEAVVDAKSGVSGAGREATETTHFVSVSENVNAYGVEGHRHAPEIDQELLALGCAEKVTFTPHLLPLDQGLLASCYVTPTRELDADELRAAFRRGLRWRALHRAHRSSRRASATCATPTSAASTRPSSRAPAARSCSARSTISGRAPRGRQCRTST